MSKKLKIDNTDRKILSCLIQDARKPFLEIARECGISGAAIHQRIRKLEDKGVIEGSKFKVRPQSVGYDLCVFVGVYLDQAHMYKNVVKAFKAIPEIVECHYTTGEYALLLKMYCESNEHLMDILVNTIQNINGVSRTETFISLEQTISRDFEL
ncbi:MAG: Lrp/AsnC family transcriptional regulator [Bacteroidales bacterium]